MDNENCFGILELTISGYGIFIRIYFWIWNIAYPSTILSIVLSKEAITRTEHFMYFLY